MNDDFDEKDAVKDDSLGFGEEKDGEEDDLEGANEFGLDEGDEF